MKFTRTVLVFLLVAFVTGAMALEDNDPFKVVWEAPVDEAFFLDSNNTVDITISIYGQDDSLMDGLVPQLTVDATTSGNMVVNRQNMTDNGDGTYTYSDVDLSRAVDSYLELEVRVPLGSGFRTIRSRITVFYGASYGPDADAWKIDFVSPVTAEQAATDSIEITIEIYNDSGQLWAGESPDITISNIQGFGMPVNGAAMTDNDDGTYSYTVAPGVLAENTDYEIRVDANTANAVRDFRTVEITPGPKVELIPIASPTYETRPVFNWHPFAGASTYTIVIDNNANFLSPIITTPTSDTFYNTLIDLPAGTIYWQVTADNNPGGAGVGTFEILDPTIPLLIAYTPDPTREKRPTLTWHSVSGATSYEIQIDDGPFFGTPTISESVSDTFYTPLIDLASGTMYWRVRSDLNTAWSDVDNFTILNDSVPLLYTFDGDTVSTARPAFAWEPVNGASQYRIDISTSRTFNTTIIRTPTSDTTYTPLIDLAPDSYYWRVSSDLSAFLFSRVDSFVVEVGPGVEAGGLSAGPVALSVRPNPFNLVTSIVIYNPGRNASVRILDICGRVVEEFKDVPDGKVVWNTTGLSKGVYIVKARTAGKTLTRKISLIK